MELQRDDLPLAARELGHCGPERGLGLLLIRRVVSRRVLRINDELGSSGAMAELVEGGVASDSEQPGSLLAPTAVECSPPAVRTLEGECGYILGGGLVSEKGHHVGVHVISA